MQNQGQQFSGMPGPVQPVSLGGVSGGVGGVANGGVGGVGGATNGGTTGTGAVMMPGGEQLMETKIAEKIAKASSILVALSKDPSVDEISAALGLTMLLDSMGKHVTAIYSGRTPNVLRFLKPEKTFETNANSLQDFIIALNKDKADHLRYKVDGDFVKIYITPYKTKISEKDLEFSHGDFNVDLIIAIDVKDDDDLDAALVEHGRIMHDAGTVNISIEKPGRFGETTWCETGASSVCEMVTRMAGHLQTQMTPEVATALLTGVVANTEKFMNERTTPEVMGVASKLMAAGANQVVISQNITGAKAPEMGAKIEEELGKPLKSKKEGGGEDLDVSEKKVKEANSDVADGGTEGLEGGLEASNEKVKEEKSEILDEKVEEERSAEARELDELAAMVVSAAEESAEKMPGKVPDTEPRLEIKEEDLGGEKADEEMAEKEPEDGEEKSDEETAEKELEGALEELNAKIEPKADWKKELEKIGEAKEGEKVENEEKVEGGEEGKSEDEGEAEDGGEVESKDNRAAEEDGKKLLDEKSFEEELSQRRGAATKFGEGIPDAPKEHKVPGSENVNLKEEDKKDDGRILEREDFEKKEGEAKEGETEEGKFERGLSGGDDGDEDDEREISFEEMTDDKPRMGAVSMEELEKDLPVKPSFTGDGGLTKDGDLAKGAGGLSKNVDGELDKDSPKDRPDTTGAANVRDLEKMKTGIFLTEEMTAGDVLGQESAAASEKVLKAEIYPDVHKLPDETEKPKPRERKDYGSMMDAALTEQAVNPAGSPIEAAPTGQGMPTMQGVVQEVSGAIGGLTGGVNGARGTNGVNGVNGQAFGGQVANGFTGGFNGMNPAAQMAPQVMTQPEANHIPTMDYIPDGAIRNEVPAQMGGGYLGTPGVVGGVASGAVGGQAGAGVVGTAFGGQTFSGQSGVGVPVGGQVGQMSMNPQMQQVQMTPQQMAMQVMSQMGPTQQAAPGTTPTTPITPVGGQMAGAMGGTSVGVPESASTGALAGASAGASTGAEVNLPVAPAPPIDYMQMMPPGQTMGAPGAAGGQALSTQAPGVMASEGQAAQNSMTAGQLYQQNDPSAFRIPGM